MKVKGWQVSKFVLLERKIMEKKLLFSPGKIGKLVIKNRGVMTAMGVGLAKENGMVSDKTVA